jgi:uncharacterized membrane protein
MIELPKTRDVKKIFFLILVVLIAMDLVILLNIPFLRQIIGFLFLTILPGLLTLQILKLNKMDLTEKFVLSVGLSISFLMFFGLLINNLSLSIGYGTPLSTIPLLISFDIALVVLVIIGCKINKEQKFSLPNLNLTTSEKAFLVIPALFPALSIFGMHIMNTTDNNIVLMFLLFLIPAYVVFVCFFNYKFPKRLYPVVIFLISISLLLLMALRSNHLIGMDTHFEYYYFRTTLNNLHWSIFGHSTLDACLAISLLPTIYKSILNISPEFLFKILYSLLFSIAPLAIYVLSKRYIGELYGFLTSCFFMSLHNFLRTPLHARTNTAILFFALAVMILFSDKIDPLKKRMLFIVFMASCMVSHYSTTYIFFFIMLGTFIGVEMLSKKYALKKVVSLTIVFLFFAMIFFWYSQVTEAAFNSGVRFIEDTFTNLNKFFEEELRSGCTQSVLGKDIGEKGIPHKIEFVLTWLTFAFIGIGIITLIRRYKEMSFSELNFKKTDFLKDKFEVGYFVAALVCSGLLVTVIALPYISTGYGMDRVHLLGIVILSMFFVIGGITLSRRLKVRAYLVILLVLIPYFFCVTGVSYQMFGVPRAITLNSEGKQYDIYYIHDQESFAGGWLEKYMNPDNRKIYTDIWGVMKVEDRVNRDTTKFDGSSLVEHKDINGYIYLRRRNIIDGILLNESNMCNITEYSDIFAVKSRIYGNGGSEVWR